MKTLVTITVDTEFSSHPEDMGISGIIDGHSYGLPLFVKILKEYDFKATFFVDVYTINKPFLKSFVQAIDELKKQGHDLQLHTHPQGTFDPKRSGMKDYSLNEQIEIIKKGKELFYEWFATTPIAHRAGDWAANYDTLKALTANDIWIDSSMFFGWSNCALNNPALTKNISVWQDGLLEIPASVFECVPLGVFSPFRLVSTDGNSYNETKELLETFHQEGAPVVNLVYHSFSFIKWNKARTEYSVDQIRIDKFKNLMNYLSTNSNFEVKTIKDVGLHFKNGNVNTKTDFIPKRGYLASIDRIVDRLRK